MTCDKKMSKNSVLLVAAGLVGGIFIGAGSLYFVFGHSHSAASNQEINATTVRAASLSAPVAQAPSSPVIDPTPAQAVAVAQPQYATEPAQPEGVMGQQEQASASEPGGVTGVAYAVTTSGSGAVYTQVTPTYGANPAWTTGTNGLIQNPCVDPPSTHGRAYNSGSY